MRKKVLAAAGAFLLCFSLLMAGTVSLAEEGVDTATSSNAETTLTEATESDTAIVPMSNPLDAFQKPLVPIVPFGSGGSDILSAGGHWKLSIDPWGYYRIFHQKGFQQTEEMSVLYSGGSGTTSKWTIFFKDSAGTLLGSTYGSTGTIIDSYTGVPSESTPTYQTREVFTSGIDLEVTQFLQPVNNEKMLVVGLTVKNTSTMDLRVDIKSFMDTMMDIDGVNYHDDRVPIVLTPAQNCFIARASTGRQGQSSGGGNIGGPMPAPGAQYVIYYRDTPNITNADFWWTGVYSDGFTSFTHGYTTGVLGNGEPSNTSEWNQIKANNHPTLDYPVMLSNFDTSGATWYMDREIKVGESVTVSYSISMSNANNPPVLETLLPDVPVFINKATNPAETMSISGTWYDNDSAYVDLYGVVDDGTPVKHDGGSINNDPPNYSGPQPGIVGPDNRPFAADYKLGDYDFGWHVVDYYLEDPENLVSNQKSVRFVLYELELDAIMFERIDDSSAYMHGNIKRANLPSDAVIEEVGFVYHKYTGDLYNPPTIDNAIKKVALDWNGLINYPFKGLASNLSPIDDYRYRTYAKVKWLDPVTNTHFYTYEYSDPKYLTTFEHATSGDSSGPVLNAPSDGSGDGGIQIGDGGATGGAGLGGAGIFGGVGGDSAMPMATYTPSVTPTPKPQILEDDRVNDETVEMPLTGGGVVVTLVLVTTLLGLGIYIKQRKVK